MAVAAVGADVAVELQVEGGVVFFAVDVADGEGAVPGGAAAEIGVAAVCDVATEGSEVEAGVFQGSAVDVGVEGEVRRWAVGVAVVGVEGGAEGIKGAVEVEAAVAAVFFVSEVVPGEGAVQLAPGKVYVGVKVDAAARHAAKSEAEAGFEQALLPVEGEGLRRGGERGVAAEFEGERVVVAGGEVGVEVEAAFVGTGVAACGEGAVAVGSGEVGAFDVQDGFLLLVQGDVGEAELVDIEVNGQINGRQLRGDGRGFAGAGGSGGITAGRQGDCSVAQGDFCQVDVATQQFARAQVEVQVSSVDVKAAAAEVQVLPALAAEQGTVKLVVGEGVGGEAVDKFGQLAVTAGGTQQPVGERKYKQEEDDEGQQDALDKAAPTAGTARGGDGGLVGSGRGGHGRLGSCGLCMGWRWGIVYQASCKSIPAGGTYQYNQIFSG